MQTITAISPYMSLPGNHEWCDDIFRTPASCLCDGGAISIRKRWPADSLSPVFPFPPSTCTEVTPFLCPKNQRNFTAYRYRFRMPSEESGGVGQSLV